MTGHITTAAENLYISIQWMHYGVNVASIVPVDIRQNSFPDCRKRISHYETAILKKTGRHTNDFSISVPVIEQNALICLNLNRK